MKVHTRPLQWDDQFSTEIGSDRSRDSTKQIASENIYNKKYIPRDDVYLFLFGILFKCVSRSRIILVGGGGRNRWGIMNGGGGSRRTGWTDKEIRLLFL